MKRLFQPRTETSSDMFTERLGMKSARLTLRLNRMLFDILERADFVRIDQFVARLRCELKDHRPCSKGWLRSCCELSRQTRWVGALSYLAIIYIYVNDKQTNKQTNTYKIVNQVFTLNVFRGEISDLKKYIIVIVVSLWFMIGTLTMKRLGNIPQSSIYHARAPTHTHARTHARTHTLTYMHTHAHTHARTHRGKSLGVMQE